jgi:carboxymethylenebutenolidase
MALYPKLQIDTALLDVSAASEYAREKTGKAGVIGYCFGGTVAWLCSTRLKNISAAVGYYAGGISNFAAETPTAPVMLHFGNLDKHIPREGVDRLQAAHPEVEIFWYDADHGFNCDQRSSYQPEASRRARERSLAFLKSTLAS